MKLLREVLNTSGWHVSGSNVPIQLGVKFGDAPIGSLHLHQSMHEYFLVLNGTVELRVNNSPIIARKGDLLIVEPGEIHEMVHRSSDAHYLLLMPRAVPADKVEVGDRA